MYGRLASLPDEAEPVQRAQLVTALSVGTEIIELRRIAPQLGFTSELDSALEAFAQGDSVGAIARISGLDQRAASFADSDPQASLMLQTRGRFLLIRDALVQHPAYFDARAP